jgi:hypothetical protein
MAGGTTRDPFTVRVENPPVPVDAVTVPLLRGVEDPMNLNVMEDRPLYPLAGRVILLDVVPAEVEVKVPRELA